MKSMIGYMCFILSYVLKGMGIDKDIFAQLVSIVPIYCIYDIENADVEDNTSEIETCVYSIQIMNRTQHLHILPPKQIPSLVSTECSHGNSNDEVADESPDNRHGLQTEAFDDAQHYGVGGLQYNKCENGKDTLLNSLNRINLAVEVADYFVAVKHHYDTDQPYIDHAKKVAHLRKSERQFMILCRETDADQGRYYEANALWYHKDEAQHVHDYCLTFKVL